MDRMEIHKTWYTKQIIDCLIISRTKAFVKISEFFYFEDRYISDSTLVAQYMIFSSHVVRQISLIPLPLLRSPGFRSAES